MGELLTPEEIWDVKILNNTPKHASRKEILEVGKAIAEAQVTKVKKLNPIMFQEEAELIGWLLERGWIPPEDAEKPYKYLYWLEQEVNRLNEKDMEKHRLDRTELERRIDLDALAGTHRVIPCFKDHCDGEPIDAFLTSASINKILDKSPKHRQDIIPTEEEIRKQLRQELCSNCDTPLLQEYELALKLERAEIKEGERIRDLQRGTRDRILASIREQETEHPEINLSVIKSLVNLFGQTLKEE